MASTAVVNKTPQTFTKKKIDVTFTIPSGAIGPGSTADTVKLSGHRVQANVTNAGMVEGAQASLRIEGMTLALMNRLSMVRALLTQDNPTNDRFNGSIVTVQAGDDVSGMSTIFIGAVAEAFVDFSGAPRVAFQVLAYSNLQAKVLQALPTTYSGSTSAATIFSELASKAGYAFYNHGVTKSVSNFYEPGSISQQIDKLAHAVQAIYQIDAVNSTLTVWGNAATTDTSKVTVKISKTTGLIGYPQYNQQGVGLQTIFNPQIQFYVPFYLKSEYLPEGWVNNQAGQYPAQFPSTGYWRPFLIQHDLSAELPGGPWFTNIQAQRAELPATQVTPS